MKGTTIYIEGGKGMYIKFYIKGAGSTVYFMREKVDREVC